MHIPVCGRVVFLLNNLNRCEVYFDNIYMYKVSRDKIFVNPNTFVVDPIYNYYLGQFVKIC